MEGKFKMTKRFEKELAEAETILSNYEKNLAKNTVELAEKVKNLAQVFDTEDELNGKN